MRPRPVELRRRITTPVSVVGLGHYPPGFGSSRCERREASYLVGLTLDPVTPAAYKSGPRIAALQSFSVPSVSAWRAISAVRRRPPTVCAVAVLVSVDQD